MIAYQWRTYDDIPLRSLTAYRVYASEYAKAHQAVEPGRPSQPTQDLMALDQEEAARTQGSLVGATGYSDSSPNTFLNPIE